MFKMDLEKAQKTEVKLPTSIGSSKKQQSARKKQLLLLYWPYQNFDCVNHKTNKQTKNFGKFLKRWEYQITLPISWEICMQVKKQQLELDVDQQTGSK